MSTSFSDIKYSLRKREFPYCARDALTKAEELLCSNSTNRGQKEIQMEFISDIISEFIFNEGVDRRGIRKKLKPLEELELALVVSDHMLYDCSNNEASRNAIFLSLFPPNKTERAHILVTMTSLALSMSCFPLLNAAAILIQQVGYTTPYSKKFVFSLVEEFFLLIKQTSSNVRDLPQSAPLFVANFLTTVSDIYGYTGKDFVGPPNELLSLIAEWVSSRTVCLSPLVHKLQPVLPQGGIPMPAITPYGGLFRWTIGSCCLNEIDPLYQVIETRLIESLKESVHVQNRMSSIISSQDILSLIPFVHKVPSVLPRFASIVAISLQTKAIYGPKQELWRQMSNLPKNELLETILKQGIS